MESEEMVEKIKKFIKEKDDYHKFENKVWTNVSSLYKWLKINKRFNNV